MAKTIAFVNQKGGVGENHQLRQFGLLPPGCGGQGAGLRL